MAGRYTFLKAQLKNTDGVIKSLLQQKSKQDSVAVQWKHQAPIKQIQYRILSKPHNAANEELIWDTSTADPVPGKWNVGASLLKHLNGWEMLLKTRYQVICLTFS